jgi:hypothetical protein
MIHASPLWDADGNLLYRIFELGKADTPLKIVDDTEFESMVERLQDLLETSKSLDQITKYGQVNPILIPMPHLGGPVPGLTSEITKILVKPGDILGVNTDIMEVIHDKASVVFSAGKAGKVITILVREGQEVAENDPLVAIEEIE